MDLFWYLNKTHFAPGKFLQFIISVIWVLMECCILFSSKYWHELERQHEWKKGRRQREGFLIPPIIKHSTAYPEESTGLRDKGAKKKTDKHGDLA